MNDFDVLEGYLDSLRNFEGTISSPREDIIRPLARFLLTVDGETFTKRIISCAVISLMPPEGMNEVYSTLKSSLEFYRESVTPPSTSEPQRLRIGRIGRSFNRPDLIIGEE